VFISDFKQPTNTGGQALATINQLLTASLVLKKPINIGLKLGEN